MCGSSVSFKGLVSMRALAAPAAVWLQVCVRSDDFFEFLNPWRGQEGRERGQDLKDQGLPAR